MKKYPNVLILLALMTMTSCAMLEHRDFEAQMDPLRMDDDPLFMPNKDFSVVSGDEGRFYRSDAQISSRTPATQRMKERSRYENSIKRELFALENRMNEAEYQEYIRIANQLGTDSQKIYFLSLSPRQRQDYLAARGIQQPRYYTVKETQMARFSNDIVLGMGKSDVINSWGKPDRKDVAGDPRYQNERWAYSRNGKLKFIYFEGGQVGGWTEQ